MYFTYMYVQKELAETYQAISRIYRVTNPLEEYRSLDLYNRNMYQKHAAPSQQDLRAVSSVTQSHASVKNVKGNCEVCTYKVYDPMPINASKMHIVKLERSTLGDYRTDHIQVRPPQKLNIV